MLIIKMNINYKLFIYLLFICEINCFNLDARIPIIKRGQVGSYFGYSVAEHEEIDESSINNKNWILVGAPLDQNRQPGTNRSGALWKCPLTTSTRDCTQVITDGRPRVDTKDLLPPGLDEIKNGQWLGVTVRSQSQTQNSSGKVMVCAHRHIVRTDNSQWGQGQCYILTNNLEFDGLKKPCSGKRTEKAHEQYGYCQAGTSGYLTSDDDVVIGTPGPHTWRGTFYISSISDAFLTQDSTIYSPPLQDSLSPVEKYSYLGMSVTAGKFFGGNDILYASGAPRSNGSGNVIIFSRKKQQPDMNVVLSLEGEQFASSFGYEIAAADINGDNITDLIVSAPFYFDKDKGGAVYIYKKLCKLSDNNINDHDNNKCKPIKLFGKEESRFGFSLANIGDINHDGYEDIAIGAPYEGKGSVYIYLGSKNGIIINPSQIIHSDDLPMPLNTFGYSLSGGIDMDKNGYPDLLIGAYDDNAVVLLRSRKIIDITTFIQSKNKDNKYQFNIESIDPNKNGCIDDIYSNYTCFSFEACCQTDKLENNENLKLNYHIEAETFSGIKKFSRVWFLNDANKSNIINRTIILDNKKLRHCQNEIVYVKENTRDIQSPIKFKLNYTLIQDTPIMPNEGDDLTDIKNYPILNQQESAKIFDATFQKDCGDNDICESNLIIDTKLNLSVSSVDKNYYELLLGEINEIIIEINVKNNGESAYEAQLFIIHAKSLSYIGSKSNDTAICNLFNTTMVICSIGNPLRSNNSAKINIRFDPKDVEDNEPQLKFIIFGNTTSNEINNNKQINLQVIVVKRAELSINGSAKTQWAYYGGDTVGESAIKNLNEIGPKVSHIYEIFNDGPWKVRQIEVIISWPYEVANDKLHGKWLLYLEDMPIINHSGGGECYLPAGQTPNPLKLLGSINYDDLDPIFGSTTLSPSTIIDNKKNSTTFNHIRERRDTEKVVNTKTIIEKDGTRRQVVSMNCKAGTAKCFDIRCIIYNLQKKQEATITVKARLWNSTLAEDYPTVDKVRIGSNARIVIPSAIEIQQENLKNDYSIAETIAYPDPSYLQDVETVSIWIIIVAIVAGLLLLILLTLILWKLGFFKRRRPDPTLSGNLEKHRDDNPESEALFKH
ncbi:integrin alpha-PS1 isoform X2 [Aphidius gifuensis]|nr:integrin alpha-PS1 isoform X2 [Aphidius gifuensis]